MECPYNSTITDNLADPGRMIVRHSTCQSKSSTWFDQRVFYVRISSFEVDQSTPEYLTLNHIPLSPDTLLEVSGGRNAIYRDTVSSLLRRDRVDKKYEEATFVSTDSIRMSGSVKFEVYDRNDLFLSGLLEMCSNGFYGESKSHGKRWSMNCQSAVTAGMGFLKARQYMSPEFFSPIVDVYVAGCFSGTPIILTKTLKLSFRRKHARKGMLDSIPENETAENRTDEQALQLSQFQEYKQESDDDDYNSLYPIPREEYIESEDGELTWFNAGVRVGVGIGLGICVGIGIGVGLLVRTYQATARNFKRRHV